MDQKNKEASDKGTRTTMQIAMSAEDKRLIKIMAARRGTTAAALVHEWIENAWIKENGKERV